MRASLKDFIQIGSFGLIELGTNRSAVEQHLGLPDDWLADARNCQTSNIWRYGDIEFYFQQDELYMIFADAFSILSGGSKIELDAWVINGDITCAEAERVLLAADIVYRKEDLPYNEGVRLTTSSGTSLHFYGENALIHSLYRKTNPKA
jgi:hypothetical protein